MQPNTPNTQSDKKQESLPIVQPQKISMARYAGFAAAGVIIGVIVAWGAGAWHSAPTKTAQNSTNTINSNNDAVVGTDAGMPAEGSDASLVVMSPQSAGTEVQISKAIVSEPTWVVVYENQDGKPGNALGASLFFPDHQSGAVELLRSTVSGRSYLAVKQVDNGDHRFSLKDDPLLSEGGQVQWVTFQVK